MKCVWTMLHAPKLAGYYSNNLQIARNYHVIPPSDRTAIIRDRTATTKCTRSPANVNTTREKVSKNYKLKPSCVLTAFLLRSVRSYHVLTARPPRPLCAYGVSCEIYGLGNGDHGRSRGALTTIMGFLPRVFYVYRECTRPPGVSTTFSRRPYIKRINFFGNFQTIIVQSYCTINIWCSISKFWISSDMMMTTKYSDENDVVVVRTP